MLDNQSNAQNVLFGTGIQSFTGEVSNYDGTDFYKFQQNARSEVYISGYGFSGNLDISILDINSKLLASSNNPGSSSESINITLDPGTYFIRADRSLLNKDPLFTGSPYKLSFAKDSIFRNIDDKNPNGQMFYTGDFDGDGVQDIFRQERGNWVDGIKDAEVIMGKASGVYDAPIQVSNSGLFEGNHNRLTFGDFNGDGKTDIIRQEYNGWIDGVNDTQFISFQNGNFQVVGNVPDMAAMRGDLTNLIAGDFNGDGKTDIIRQEKGAWVNGSRDAELYISNGTFAWASQTVLTNAFAVNGNDTLLVAGDFIAGGGQDLMRIETASSWIDGVNDLQFLTYQGGNLAVVGNTPTNIKPQASIVNGVKSSYNVNSTLTIDPSYISDNDGWQDVTKVDFWLTNAQSQRVELADVNKFTANGANSAKFNYSTSLSGIAAGNYKLNAIAYDKAGTASNLFTQSITINSVFTLGFNGTNTNAAYINTFNQVNGTQILGKAASNVRSIAGGTVQDFERGSIFQSIAGTFALRGTLNNFYKDLSAADKLRLGLPTANETSVGGWHQSFQNGNLQLVQGVPVKWSNQTLISDRYNLLGGANSLGKSIGTIRNFNGSAVQDYEKGSIFISGNKTIAVTGSIATYYRANSATLGLPTSEESTTSYGKRQDFSNGKTLINSAQFGTQVVQGSLGGYYRGLSEAQRNQLGAPYTGENDLSGGNWRQFFKGGTVEWKNNGTGEIKLTPFTIGFDGTSVNTAFTNEFNKVVGWEALAKATGNVRNINGGTVQDFEKGSIVKSSAGTFAVRGSIGIYYRANSSTLLLPTSSEIATSYGWRQDFQGAVVTHSPQFGTQVLEGSLGSYYRGLSETQRNQLGAIYTGLKNLGGGNWRQFFAGGTVEWKNNGTGEVKLTPLFSVGLTGNTVNNSLLDKFNSADGWNTLGNPTSNVKTISGGMVQDFQKGSIFQSGKGTFVLDGVLLDVYRQQYSSSIGLPIGDKVSTVNGLRQDFENGILINTPTAQTFAIKGAIATYYKGLSVAQLQELGAPTSNIYSANGILRQDFQKGSITQNGSTVESLLWPTNLGLLGRDYLHTTGKTLASLPVAYTFTVDKQTDSFISISGIQGDAKVSLFNSQNQLIANDISGGNSTRLIDTSLAPGNYTIKVTSGSVGNFILNVMPLVTINTPTPPVPSTTSLGLLGQNSLYANGMTSNVLPTIYSFTVDRQINSFISISAIQGDAKFSLFNSQNQLIANDISGGNNTRLIDTSLAPGNYIVKITSGSFGSFTLNVTPLVTISNPAPQPTGGGIVIVGSVGNYYYSLSTESRQQLGSAKANQVFIGGRLEWKQDFQNGTIFHGAKGSFVVKNSLKETYYNDLSSDDRQRLGMPIGNETQNGGYWHQSFENGELQLVGGSPVKWSGGSNNPATGVTVGFDGTSAHNTYINTFNRLGGSGAIGSATNNVHPWGNGYLQDFQGGSQGSGAILKSNANDNSYWVGGGFWNAYLATGNGVEGALGYPTSDRIGNRQNFQNGALISGSNGIFAVYGGIGGHYLNNEGGENGRLGAPTSKEEGLGGNKIVQHFQYGDILYGIGATSTLMTAGGAVNYKEFAGVVRSDVGIKLRQRPTTGSNDNGISPYNQVLQFDAWTTGDSIPDPSRNNALDNRWFHVVGTNNWVASAYIYGEPGNSINTPFPPTTNIEQPPSNGGSSPTNGASRSFNSSFFREGNIFWTSGNAPVSTGSPNNKLGNAKGNCTWYVNGRLQELGYSAATLNKLWGNAQDWDNQAIAAGITISSTPKVGSIAQWENGHVAVVERVNADGTILISESSYSPSSGSAADYLYKEETISASNPSRYIIVDKNILPISPGTSPIIPGTFPIIPGTSPIIPGTSPIISSGFPLSEIITSRESRAIVSLISKTSQPIIFRDQPTWVLIHGMDNSSSDMDNIAQSIPNDSNVQILKLDWKEFAKTNQILVIDGASHIIDVAKWAAKKLHDLGISAGNINLVGHSLGALVAYEISKILYTEFGSKKVSSIVALDPANLNLPVEHLNLLTAVGGSVGTATGILTGIAVYNAFPDLYEVNFSTYSNYSKAYHSSIFGSVDLTKTALEAYEIDLYSTIDPKDKHGKVKDYYANELKGTVDLTVQANKSRLKYDYIPTNIPPQNSISISGHNT